MSYLTLFTGGIGAGKTAAVVDYLMTIKDRPIFVNGLEGLKLEHFELEDPRKWMDCPDGSVVVLDEVQRVWRPAGASAAVPPDIAALETLRHRGFQFVLTTQHPGLLHSNVRKLVTRHVHLRDVGLLGRWWYEWPEATNVEQFRSAPVKKRYTLPKRAFSQYKSASMHAQKVRSVPRSVVVAGLALLAALGLGYRSFASVTSHIASAAPQSAPFAASASPAVASAPAAQIRLQQLNPAEQVAAAADAAASASRGNVAGCMTMGDRCSCVDKQGWPVIVEWQMCKISASSYAGVVPLAMKYDAPARPAAPASEPKPERS